MKIQTIQNHRFYYCQNNSNKKDFSYSKTNVSFSASVEKFKKDNSEHDTVKETLNLLKNQLDKLLEKGKDLKNKNFKSDKESMFAFSNYNKELEQIRAEYKKIGELLDQCDKNEVHIAAKTMMNFLTKMEKLGQNEGFNRIVGYDDVKNDLKNMFIFNSILQDKITDNTNVPNSILFYGPAGNGKTTFAIALAEQALMKPYIVDASASLPEEVMEKIEQYAKEAKEIYEKSNDKKRSIIVIDEVDLLTYEDSPVIEHFINLINKCSDEYKCTLFLTTNNPLDLPKEILSKNNTPFKVPIAPPDEKTAKGIIDKKLKQAGCFPQEDTQRIIDELFKNPNKIYSNSNLSQIVETILSVKEKPSINDFIMIINNGDSRPSLRLKDIAIFQTEMKKLT